MVPNYQRAINATTTDMKTFQEEADRHLEEAIAASALATRMGGVSSTIPAGPPGCREGIHEPWGALLHMQSLLLAVIIITWSNLPQAEPQHQSQSPSYARSTPTGPIFTECQPAYDV